MLGVRVRDGENIERALKKLKGITEGAGIIAEIKAKRGYEKPSEIKRRKLKAAFRKQQMSLLEDSRYRRY